MAAASKKKEDLTLQEIVSKLQIDICELGATEKRCIEYIKTLEKVGLIERHGARFKINNQGRDFLRRKVI